MMTRKDFEMLADALRGVETFSDSQLVVWEECRDAVAAACSVSNPDFDYTKFRDRSEAE